MGQKQTKPFYFPPELKETFLCASVLAIVLEENQRAKELYADIEKCFELPGCKDPYDVVTYLLPDGRKVLQGNFGNTGDVNKEPKSVKNPFDVSMDLQKGNKKLNSIYRSRPKLFILLNNRKRRDLNKLRSSISVFIREGFNRNSENDKREYKVNGNVQSSLGTTILLPALIKKLYGDTSAIEKTKLLKHGKKDYDLPTVLERKIPDSADRFFTGQLKQAGYSKTSLEKIKTSAWRWYQCRVVCDGPTEYYNKQLKERSPKDRVVVEPENLIHEIKEFDDALGYRREKTGKRKS